MEEAAVNGGFSQLAKLRSLLNLRRNAVELRIEGRADRVDSRDNHNRDASSDQAAFDRCGARLVLQERKNLRHWTSS